MEFNNFSEFNKKTYKKYLEYYDGNWINYDNNNEEVKLNTINFDRSTSVSENFNRILNDRTRTKGPKASFLFSVLRSITQEYYSKYCERVNDLHVVNQAEEGNNEKKRLFESEKEKFKKEAESFLRNKDIEIFMGYSPVIQQLIHRDYDEGDKDDEWEN